jgi:hypothetical protein
MYVDLYMSCRYKLSKIIVLQVLLFAYNGYWAVIPVVKWSGHGGVNHPPLSSTKVKERAQLYLYPPPHPHGLFNSELDLLNPVWLVQDTVI